MRGIELFAVLFIAADLMIASWGFNPASDPAWLDFTPPAIEWLQAQPGDWRYTTYEDPTNAVSHLLNANMTLRYGLDDVRGYESIIPKTYMDFMELIAPQVQRDYNRVAPIYTAYSDGFDPLTALSSPYLDLLNVRYVVTYKQTDMSAIPGFTLAYEDDAVRIWENGDALPRAYLLRELPRTSFEPLVQERRYTPVEITSDTGRELFLDVTQNQPSWLVISQSYDPGWRAYIRPQGADENAENAVPVEILLNALPFVRLSEGAWTIRLVYSPASFQIGLFATFISAIILLLIAGIGLWRRFVGEAEGSGVHRIARNSLAPILLNLFNRGIDMAFALVMLRILGPNDAGLYFYAGVIFIWFDIFTNFGLNLYLTREVSRDRSKAGYLFFNTSALRIGLALLGVPLLLGFLGVRQSTVSPPLDMSAVVAIGLLYIGLLPNSLSTGLTSLYYAFERAEVPAAVATVATICKSVFGLVALLLGWGIIGLAGVSIATNVITLAILAWNGRAMYAGMTRRVEPPLMRRMLGASYPLMFNHFLATIFFQIDVVLIEAIHNPTMVGQYSVAYKWVSALNVIPSFFTQALLPVMSRQAHEDRASLKRMYTLAIKLLVSVALPTAVIFTFAAEFLAGVLGGAQYLPDGAIATQLMIWSIPIGWMNSLTQYVLIALDLQKRITTAFILGVGFNIIANLILIPPFGYRAAALTTIASEAVLLVPFALLLQGAVGRLNWLDMLWRPIAAALVMALVTGLLWSTMPLVALVVGGLAYLVVLIALRPLNADEITRLLPLIPARLRRRFS
ncbi:MAG: oligosaccharide flippase family protein [Chloroflexi bacterium]|nr:oligosaccharide flippase family protein [Chloroflexota bacterium]